MSELDTLNECYHFVQHIQRHADTTWVDLVRDDYSTFHAAEYDVTTGDLEEQGGVLAS